MSGKSIHVPAKVWDLTVKAGTIFLICLIVGGMITLFSPSATLTMDSDERLEFWIYLCLIGGTGIFACDVILTYFEVKWHSLLKALLQSICGAIVVLIPVFMLYDPYELPSTSTTIIFVWFVMVLIVAGTFIVRANAMQSDSKPETAFSSGDMKAPKILKRLPIHLQEAELYAVSAEDHYVRVHMSKGEDLILMRLSDAIAETGNVEGLQIHRSWWVSRAAITDIKSKGRAAEVTLQNNVKAPVSRNALKELKTLGWL